MVHPETLAARIERAKVLLSAAREAAADARNQRQVAILRRAVDRLTRLEASLPLRVRTEEQHPVRHD
jgi:hypothetical protein